MEAQKAADLIGAHLIWKNFDLFSILWQFIYDSFIRELIHIDAALEPHDAIYNNEPNNQNNSSQ